jgi:hypothetical protein
MNFFEHKKGELVSRLIILLALITLALDLLIWRA